MAISFNGVLIVAAVAVLVPVVLGFLPALPVPGAVLEVIAGIVIGPSVLGWVRIDAPVKVLSDLGPGMLLLAGLEIDVDGLRGAIGRLAGLPFAVSAVLGVGCAYALSAVSPASQPLFLAIVPMSTSAGLLLPFAEGHWAGGDTVRPAGDDSGRPRRGGDDHAAVAAVFRKPQPTG